MDDESLKRLIEGTVEKSAAETRKHSEGLAAETRQYIDQTTAETRQLLDQTTSETRKLIETTAVDTRHYVDERIEDTKRHIGVVAEAQNAKIQFLAEVVGDLDKKIDREIKSVRDEMRQGFAETQALIKFSYNELDRRVTKLENK